MKYSPVLFFITSILFASAAYSMSVDREPVSTTTTTQQSPKGEPIQTVTTYSPNALKPYVVIVYGAVAVTSLICSAYLLAKRNERK